jgi:hypothetical protein
MEFSKSSFRKRKSLLKIKTNGGALLYVIFICLVIFLLLLGFILRNELQRDFLTKESRELFFYENLNSALLYHLSNPEIKDFLPTENSNEDICIKREVWGAYSIVNASVKSASEHYTKTLLVGQKPFDQEQISLYLKESNKKTYISGRCNITGIAYIPELGIKTCYVGGSGFRGKKYIQGQTKQSEKNLPTINQIEQPSLLDTDSLIFYEEIIEKDSLINPFNKKTIFISCDDDIVINYKYLQGRIIIDSKKSITIRANSSLNDVILSAPYIEVESGYKGAIQCIAKDSILIEKNVHIKYPSALIVTNVSDTSFHKIVVEKDCDIHSDIISYCKDSKIEINEDNTIIGRIYTPGQVQLESSVFGSCYCGELFRKVNGMVYTNTIFNNEIDPTKIPTEWSGTQMFDNPQMMIKCLN